MDLVFFGILLIGFQLFYWKIGIKASKNLKNKQEYFIAEKSVRFFPLMMTLLATLVGGGLFLGSADEAFRSGWSVLLYPIGAALGFIFMGLGIGKKLAQLQVSTVAEILEVTFGSKRLRQAASIISILTLFIILVAQIVASRKFLMVLGFWNPLIFIGFWILIFLYTAKGGMKAVISTDIVQAIVFTSILFLCFAFTLTSNAISVNQLQQAHNFSPGFSKLIGWLLMPLLFSVIGQDIGQRCFAGKTPKTVSWAFLGAGIWLLFLSIIPVFFGVLAKTFNLAIPEGSSVLMTAIAFFTNPWVTALAGCAVLAAIISSASSTINSISANVANDFNFKVFNKLGNLSSIRWLTAFISLGALVTAFYFQNILGILIQGYELIVSCLFIPVFLALFKKEGTFLSGFLSMLFGLVGFIFLRIYPINFPSELISISFSFIGYLSGGIISRYKKNRINKGGLSKE